MTVLILYPPVVTRCYQGRWRFYTVNGVANTNEHGAFQAATKKKSSMVNFSCGSPTVFTDHCG